MSKQRTSIIIDSDSDDDSRHLLSSSNSIDLHDHASCSDYDGIPYSSSSNSGDGSSLQKPTEDFQTDVDKVQFSMMKLEDSMDSVEQGNDDSGETTTSDVFTKGLLRKLVGKRPVFTPKLDKDNTTKQPPAKKRKTIPNPIPVGNKSAIEKQKHKEIFPISNYTVPRHTIESNGKPQGPIRHPFCSIWKMEGSRDTINGVRNATEDGYVIIHREFLKSEELSKLCKDLHWNQNFCPSVDWKSGICEKDPKDTSGNPRRSTLILASHDGIKYAKSKTSKSKIASRAWSKQIIGLKDKINKFSDGRKLNLCIADYYGNADSKSAFDSNDEHCARKDSPNFYVHLGEERTVMFRHESYRQKSETAFANNLHLSMQHGDLMIISPGVRLHWKSSVMSIKPEKRLTESDSLIGPPNSSVKLLFKEVHLELCR